MRILHVAKYYYPYAGGMESIVKDLCEGLVQKGHEITVLCSHDKWSYEETVINGVKVIRLPRLWVLFGQNINLRAFSKLRSLAKAADIVHLHTPNPLFETASLFIPKSIPVVCTYHSDIVRQRLLLKFYKPLFNRVLSRLNSVYVPTENHIKYSEFLIHRKDKCKIVPFGIHTHHLISSDETIQEAMRLRSEYGSYCIFIGRLVGYKGIPTLLKAMQGVDQKLVIVGDGPDRLKTIQMIKELNLESKVILLGKVFDKIKFSALIHGSEFLVLPSVTPNENFGIVQLEAMACAKPVITTRLKSGVPAVGIENKTTFLSEPGNHEDLNAKMLTLFASSEMKREMGRAARVHFEENYTHQSMIEKQDHFYKHILTQELKNQDGRNDNDNDRENQDEKRLKRNPLEQVV